MLPELIDAKDGSKILTPRWNMFSQKYDEHCFDVFIVSGSKVWDCYGGYFICNLSDIDKHFSPYEIENEIALNYILMYITIKGGDIRQTTDPNLLSICGNGFYDLTSSFEDQRDCVFELMLEL